MLPLIPLFACGLGLTTNVLAGNIHMRNWINHRRITGKLDGRSLEDDDSNSTPTVPTYNFSMPVDHFDHSSDDTYPNRFFVNDTYYQAGGPVIFYDFGEAGVDPLNLASSLSEYQGSTSSAMTLASSLHGLVIGWEHRYYGYSHPVGMDDESGLPRSGLGGYKYLTVEQALEDVAYFANNFNTTKLPLNHVVKSTAKLDPYNTPWIFVGASYPGSRAAWIRAKHPEIIYASWASSAPLQTRPDGSIYINPLVRSLPKNCSSDIEAAIKYNDLTLDGGSNDSQEFVNFAVSDAVSVFSDSPPGEHIDPFQIGQQLYQGLTMGGNYQYLGPTSSVQILCDAMESFDAEEFLKMRSNDVNDWVDAIQENTGDETPSSKGVAASGGSDAGVSAFAALAYGLNVSLTQIYGDSDTSDYEPFTPNIDSASWEWQTLSEVGWTQGSNDTHGFRVISKYVNTTALRTSYVESVESLAQPDEVKVPSQINDTYMLDVGGWNAKISNVMFTNGEFDPWRAFSVASQETEVGAPGRNVTQTVPKCNKISQGNDVFGLVYPGQVHGSDISVSLDGTNSTENGERPPPEVGLKLFLEAWKVWEPCFQKSRDDIRSGKGVDGQGNDATGTPASEKDSAASMMGPGSLLPLVSSALMMGLYFV